MNSPSRTNSTFTHVLAAREVASSSELIARLGKRHKLNATTARQILHREFKGDDIWRSESVVLPGRGRLFARKGFYGEAKFLEAVLPTLERQRPGLARVLRAMLQFEAIDLDTTRKLLASPYVSVKSKYPPFERELAAVAELGIGLWENAGPGVARLLRRQFFKTEKSDALGFQLLAQRETERHLLSLLLYHYKLQHLIAWETPEPTGWENFNGQLFSGVAYSHLAPLVKYRGGKRIAFPLVFDVIGRRAELFDVQGFVERIHRAGYHTRSRLRILGVIAARSFSPEAFKLSREFGLLVVNFRELFGEKALDALAAVERLFANLVDPTESLNLGTAKTEDLATKLAAQMVDLKNHPLVTELCGIGFETFTVAVLRGSGWESVTANSIAPIMLNGTKTTREIDVCGRRGDEVIVVECKAIGETKELDPAYVRKFYRETVPAFLKKSDIVGSFKTCRAEIWTTGKVSPETEALVTSDARITRKIFSREKIPVPAPLSSLKRLLDVIGRI